MNRSYSGSCSGGLKELALDNIQEMASPIPDSSAVLFDPTVGQSGKEVNSLTDLGPNEIT
jgi:hypothetical protein